MSLRDDVVLRAVHQLVEALLRAAGLRKKKDLPASEQALGDGLQSMGLPLELIARLDPASLVALVPDPSRRALVCAALAELACLRQAQGRGPDARDLRERARALAGGLDDATLPEPVQAAMDHARMTW